MGMNPDGSVTLKTTRKEATNPGPTPPATLKSPAPAPSHKAGAGKPAGKPMAASGKSATAGGKGAATKGTTHDTSSKKGSMK